ncbi:YrhB domain-containing protein [Kitasatospora sp. NPDC048365]|uniref:YrhB domain-containing protein n=1 Tax=Kitasatospora sp. NPDC048365 TaxID=3364050 RepID=UPI00371B96E3
MLPGMFDRAYAVRIVQEDLDRKYSGRLVVVEAEANQLVWVVHYQHEEYVRTRNSWHLLAGNHPYLVDRVDGSLHDVHSFAYTSGEWEADYRVRVRKMRVRTAVDDLHDELRRAVVEQGRMTALRMLRERVPVLSPADAVAYVTALQGGAAPERLLPVVAGVVLPPPDPFMAVRTIRPGPVPGVCEQSGRVLM